MKICVVVAFFVWNVGHFTSLFFWLQVTCCLSVTRMFWRRRQHLRLLIGMIVHRRAVLSLLACLITIFLAQKITLETWPYAIGYGRSNEKYIALEVLDEKVRTCLRTDTNLPFLCLEKGYFNLSPFVLVFFENQPNNCFSSIFILWWIWSDKDHNYFFLFISI